MSAAVAGPKDSCEFVDQRGGQMIRRFIEDEHVGFDRQTHRQLELALLTLRKSVNRCCRVIRREQPELARQGVAGQRRP